MRVLRTKMPHIKKIIITVFLLLPMWQGEVDAQSVDHLLEELRDPTWSVRREAARQLGALRWGDLGPDDAVISALVLCLTDRSPAVRLAAATALGAIGPAAKGSVPALIRVLTDMNNTNDLRCAAIRALGAMGPAAQEAVPAMISVLTDYHHRSEVRLGVIEVLESLGPLARSAAPALAGSATDYNNSAVLRQAAAAALSRVSSDDGDRHADIGRVPALTTEATVAPHLPLLDAETWRLGGVTLIPLKPMAEWLGAKTVYDPLRGTVTVNDTRQRITLQVGATTAKVNGTDITMPLPVFIVESITLVPLRCVTESVGAEVQWHPDTQEIIVSLPDRQIRIHSPPTPPETEQALAEAASLIAINTDNDGGLPLTHQEQPSAVFGNAAYTP
ncbi:MAG: stalk domain-containing protein [Limnochordia bacterium]|jgi:hypothetical protein